MEIIDLCKILQSHVRWLNGSDGIKVDLSEADLRLADLSRADFSKAYLRSHLSLIWPSMMPMQSMLVSI